MSDEVVMITGASQGIGRAMAASFAANRAKLLLIDRKPLTYSTDSQ
jgi:short-subunit dehydrogenase